MSFIVQAHNASHRQHLPHPSPLSEQTKTLSYQPCAFARLFPSYKEEQNHYVANTRLMAISKNLSKKKNKTKKKQQFAVQKKSCANFITRLKSWVNYVCLSSNGANQLFVYLAPPRGPGPYACLDYERGHTGQDPASLAGTRDCVCWSVRVHPSVTTEVGRVTDHPWPPWECGASADCFGYRCRVCSHAWAYTLMYTPVCSHQAPRLWIYIYKQSSCLTPNRWHHTPPPPLPYQCVLNQMGCQGHLWPPTALWLMGQPSPVTPPSIVPWRASDTALAHLLRTLPPRTWAS